MAMGISRLTGCVWHKEKVHRADGETRRYKGRCEYYHYDDEHCSYTFTKCCCCAHCPYYRAITDEAFKARQRVNQLKKRTVVYTNKDDDCYWYI